MCIGFWALDYQDYALILCTNRDEYLDRPTKNAHFHSSFRHEAGFILSGIDQLKGGTWFGLNRAGRVALLTNITEPPPPEEIQQSTRGCLVSSYLLCEGSDPRELGSFVPRDAIFAGFNLLLFEPVMLEDPGGAGARAGGLRFEASLVSNGGAGGQITSRPLTAEEKSCGAMSNGIDGKGANEWPKVRLGIQEFKSVLQKIPPDSDQYDVDRDTQITELLFHLLSWQSPEPVTKREELRNTVHVSPLSISGQEGYYGTRLSTVVLVRKDGQISFVERDVWKLVDGKVMKGADGLDRVFRFFVDPNKT